MFPPLRTDRMELSLATPTGSLLAGANIQHAQDAIIAKDLTGRIVCWNEGAERVFGYRAAEVIGKPFSILGFPGKWFEVLGLIERVAAGARIDHYETIRRRKDGSEVRVSVTVSPIKDAAGHVVGVATIDRDITDRHDLEGALERGRGDVAGIAIDKDLSGNIRYWGDEAERFYGYSSDEVVGRPISLLIPPDRVQEMDDILATIRAVGEPIHGIPTTRLKKSGEQVEVTLDALPLRTGGRLVGVRSVVRLPVP
jgi:PAS domain S-box-containing protein